MKISITGSRSSKSVADYIAVPIKCPKCGHETKHRLADLESDPLIVCGAPGCGQKIQINSGGSAKEAMNNVRDLDGAIDDLIKK